jgi:N-acetylglutamate synthase-like GNAT family acetyltransferase
MSGAGQLMALPLATWERDGLRSALAKAGLVTEDINGAEVLFWRFETNDIPVGFGGLEIHGDVGLLRSVVTLPPMRRRGFGTAMVAVLETEAIARNLRALYLLTIDSVPFFAKLGYAPCARDSVAASIRASAQFTALCPQTAVAMTKDL